MIGPAQLPPGDDVRLFDGLGLQLHVPGLLDAADFEEDDAMTLMEFPESSLSSGSSGPSRRSSEPQLSCSSRICTFEGTTFDAELRRRNPDQFWLLLCNILGLDRREIRQLHLVRSTPIDLAGEGRMAFILQKHCDAPSSDLLRAVACRQ